jgi:hypothetical protein
MTALKSKGAIAMPWKGQTMEEQREEFIHLSDIPKAAASYRKALMKSDDGRNVLLVFYRQFCVAKLDVDERVVIARKPFIPSVTSGEKL